ncbi:MAG TPA: hypothetical protein ENG80_06150 [Nitrospirae bacterium]|nr:hypothetical protein [Nitrospirota bacterium]
MESEIIRFTDHIRNAISTSLNPTFFEFVTAMAFYYFASEGVDCAVVEVGMGGRLDATNVLTPEVSVITNISLDHSEFLGESISDITFEKAGIIKADTPLVTAASHPEALAVLEQAAQGLSSKLHLYRRDFSGSLVSMDDRRIVFDYSGAGLSPSHTPDRAEYRNLSLPLGGKHQMHNASLAIRACEILSRRGFNIETDSIRNGLLNPDCQGRLERISSNPAVFIDSAHNPEAARSLADSIKDIFPSKKVVLVAGIMKDKDIKGILAPLIRIADSVVLTKPDSERAASPRELKKRVEEIGGRGHAPRSISIANTTAEAMEHAKKICQNGSIILVTGSFYTTGEVKELYGNKSGTLLSLREKYKMGNRT